MATSKLIVPLILPPPNKMEAFKAARNSLPVEMQMRYKGVRKFTAAMITEIMFDKEKGLGLTPLQTTAKKGAPSTSAAALKDYESHPIAGNFVKKISEQAKLEKITSTYITCLLYTSDAADE